MSVQRVYADKDRKNLRYVAKAMMRETRLTVYIGTFATEAEAKQASDAWYLKRYGGKRR